MSGTSADRRATDLQPTARSNLLVGPAAGAVRAGQADF